MSELKNFPFKNQLNEPNIDGMPDQNAGMNCLPTCLACGTQFLIGKQYTGSEIEHVVYGRNYYGGTAAVEYVSYEAAQGVRLYALSSHDTKYLVEQAHVHLALGHPVVCTIPSSYAPPADPFNPGSSHCVVFYKDQPNMLAAMNPWQAFSQANSDAWWSARMCYGQVWIMEKGASMGVPQGWKDSGEALVAPNGKAVVLGFRKWILAHDWRGDDVPLGNEYGTDTGSRQDFLYEFLLWDKQSNVISSHPYGQEYLRAVSENQALQAQIKTLQATPNPTTTEEEKTFLNSLIQAIQGQIGKLS
jgi:hypothetical protein